VSGETFLRMLGRQLAGDIAQLPQGARARFFEAARVRRAVNVADLRELARRRLPPAVFDYVDGAAWDELTAQRNQSDLRELVLRPRVLAGLADIDLSTEVLGQRVSIPVLGAPTGMTGLVHHTGEIAIARAVHAAGGLYVLSSAASRNLEEVAAASPGPRWFQLYVGRDRGLVTALLERARAGGYAALVVTVDVARAGARERDRRNGFTVPPRIAARTLVDGVRRPRWTANFLRRPRILSEGLLSTVAADGTAASLAELIGRQFDPSLSWSDIAWLQEH
jgi:L-lactate dehydrogenase (cytochrome)